VLHLLAIPAKALDRGDGRIGVRVTQVARGFVVRLAKKRVGKEQSGGVVDKELVHGTQEALRPSD